MKNLPEKIYLNFGEITKKEFEESNYNEFCKLDEFAVTFCEDRVYDTDVEFVRTDAFIEKACKWIEEFNNHNHIMRYSDSCEPPLSELTEWFKNYMKGEEYGKCI